MKMASNEFYHALRPILLLSKYLGTLPLNFVEIQGRISVATNRVLAFFTLIYSCFNIVRDFKYVHSSFAKQVKRFVPAGVLVALGDFSYSAFVVCLYASTWTRVKQFPLIFQKFDDISAMVQLPNATRAKFTICIIFIFIQSMDTLKFLNYLVKAFSKFTFADALTWCMSYLSLINLNVVDMEFWAQCYLVYQYLTALNDKLRAILLGQRLHRIEITRPTVCNLIDISELINSLYGTCLLCSLSMRCINLQHDGFLCLRLYYERGDVFDRLVLKYAAWFAIHLSRCLLLVWVCSKVKSEVRFVTVRVLNF
jgi:7tm Chemosensory receptor